MEIKKVLVTGGTQGVGLETVKMLVEQGYEVHLTYRRSAGKAEELMEKYAERYSDIDLIRARLKRLKRLTSLQSTNGTE